MHKIRDDYPSYSNLWNYGTPRKGFRLAKTSKHRNQKRK